MAIKLKDWEKRFELIDALVEIMEIREQLFADRIFARMDKKKLEAEKLEKMHNYYGRIMDRLINQYAGTKL